MSSDPRFLVSTLALIFVCLAASVARADEVECACGPFDQPDRVVREGTIDFADARRVTATEVYLANSSLRAGYSAPFVISGSDAGSPGRVRFQAREAITLGPGFHAQRGSVFEASILPREVAGSGRSVWPSDTEAADRSPGATTAVVVADPDTAPPDPHRIEPMRPPRRPQLIATQ